MGNAYTKQEKYQEAIDAYSMALTEHRNADSLQALQKVEKLKAEKDKLSYIDPAKSLEEKNLGNDAFHKGDFPTAVKHYSEAIKRNPQDHVLYSNRAACYTKLGEYILGERDCDKAIELNPTFGNTITTITTITTIITPHHQQQQQQTTTNNNTHSSPTVKAYTRKGHIQFFLKQYHKCLETYDKGLKLEPENPELVEGIERTIAAINSRQDDAQSEKEVMDAAARDPEIQNILQDPVIRKVLQDLQNDPRAAQVYVLHNSLL